MKSRKISISHNKESILESKETSLFKYNFQTTIPIDFKNINKLKKEVLSYIDSNLLFKYSTKLEGVLINYNNLKLKNKCSNIIDDYLYYNIPVVFNCLVFSPKINNYCLAKISKLTNNKIYLSFYDIIDGIVYLDSSDYKNSDLVEDHEDKNSHNRFITYSSPSNLNKSKNYTKCIYKCEKSHFTGSKSVISTLESEDISIKLEEGKFIKVLISEIIRINSEEKNCILICDIDITNLN